MDLTPLLILPHPPQKPDLTPLKHLLQQTPTLQKPIFNDLIRALKTPHAQKRRNAIAILIWMEQRCHNVITWILEGENIECIIQKTLGRGEKLPKPQEEQIEMGKLTLDAIAKWRDKYGHKYLQFGKILDHIEEHPELYTSEAIDNHSAHAVRSRVQQRAQLEGDMRLNVIHTLYQAVEAVYKENIQIVRNCFDLLLPPDARVRSEEQGSHIDDIIQAASLGTHRYNLEISVDKIILPNADNQLIYNDLIPAYKYVSGSNWSQLKEWIREVSSLHTYDCNPRNALLESMRGRESQIQSLVQQSAHFNLPRLLEQELEQTMLLPMNTGVESDEEFEEATANPSVPVQYKRKTPYIEDGVHANIKDNVPALFVKLTEEEKLLFSRSGAKHSIHHDTGQHEPTSSPKAEAAPDVQPASTEDLVNDERKALLARAPVVEYGTDLSLWGKNTHHMPSGFDVQHRFWNNVDTTGEVSEPHLKMLKSRLKYVKEEEDNVPILPCGAPLKNGKFCSRQDKVKCPFHGLKVARDAKGQPLTAANELIDASYERPSWLPPLKTEKVKAPRKKRVSSLKDISHKERTIDRISKRLNDPAKRQQLQDQHESAALIRMKDKLINQF